MTEPVPSPHKPGGAAALIRLRIEAGEERVWRLEDFRDLPFAAVAQALSRLAKRGVIERLSKGIYYRGRLTAIGKSRPNPAVLQLLAASGQSLFPSGLAAANLLGFSTQISRNVELATSGLSLPRKLVGKDTVIHTRRPEAWSGLTVFEAALLDFLRRGGQYSELPPEETLGRLLALLAEPGCFDRLMGVAATEPPRVRALLGALGEQLGKPRQMLHDLRTTLNPFSRYDFGVLSILPGARAWQAKEHQR
jgi:hypothetical protein